MLITSIEAIPFRLPVRREFRWNGLHQGLGHFVLARIRTDSGITGYGEAVPLPDWGGDYGRRGGETRATVAAIIEANIGPVLLGTDPCAITSAIEAMDRIVIGHTYAKCAIEMALHDIWGKSTGIPLYRLLGGRAHERVPIAHMVGLMPIGDAVDEAAAATADGIQALQIKGGEDASRDITLIQELRRRLGPQITLRLDANRGYGSAKRALNILSSLPADCLNYVEQPVEGLGDMAAVTSGTSVSVIADESCWTPRDALDVVQSRAADCISIYLAKAGGIRKASAIAAVADAAGVRCDVNGSIESGIGNAANMHFAISSRAVTLPCVIPISAPANRHPCEVGGNYFEDDIITEPFAFAEGGVDISERPGLGIEIDERKLERFRQ